MVFLQSDRDRIYNKLRLLQKINDTLMEMKNKDDARKASVLYSYGQNELSLEDVRRMTDFDAETKQGLSKGTADKIGLDFLGRLDICEGALRAYGKYKNKSRDTTFDQSYLIATDPDVRELVLAYLHRKGGVSQDYAMQLETGRISYKNISSEIIKSLGIDRVMQQLPDEMLKLKFINCITNLNPLIIDTVGARSNGIQALEGVEKRLNELRMNYRRSP